MLKLNLTNHTGSFVHSTPARATSTPTSSATSSCCRTATWRLAGATRRSSPSDPDGQDAARRGWPSPDLNYRTYVQKWVGIPYFPPSGAVRNNGAKATVYASWDGDTQVVGWRVLAGSSAQSLKAWRRRRRAGFETTIPLTSTFKAYKVQALGSQAKVLGTSSVFPTASGRTTGCRAHIDSARQWRVFGRGAPAVAQTDPSGRVVARISASCAWSRSSARAPPPPRALRQRSPRNHRPRSAPAPKAPERAAARVRVPDPGRPLRLAAGRRSRSAAVPASQLGTISGDRFKQRGAHRHDGADSDGDGGSFIPSDPFTPGETVTVTTSLNIEGSGNGSYAVPGRDAGGDDPAREAPRRAPSQR